MKWQSVANMNSGRQTSLEGKSRAEFPKIESNEGSGFGSPVFWMHCQTCRNVNHWNSVEGVLSAGAGTLSFDS